MLKKVPLLLALGLLPVGSLSAQGLRESLSSLFTFGDCGEPLCLDGSINSGTGHGDHFLPSASGGNLAVIAFLGDAIGQSVSRLPLSSTSSGATFAIVNGIPVRTSTSAGPIFAERSQTLGRGRFFIGANFNGIQYTKLNGGSMDNFGLTFIHEDVDNAGTLGDPQFENDIIDVQLQLDVNVLVTSVFATYGLTDFIDLSVAVPFVRTTVKGSSEAQIQPFGPNALHFFGGNSTDPILRATASESGSASGIGDVAGRLKVNVVQTRKFGAAILGDLRFPTGDEEELLGSGAFAGRAIGIVSAQFGPFSPHLNGGYLVRTGELQNDAVLVTLGFDNLMTDWATLAIDFLSEWQVGENKISLPGNATFDVPFVREVQTTQVADMKQNLVAASGGIKFILREGTVLMTNILFPLTRAGLLPDFIWTVGLELIF